MERRSWKAYVLALLWISAAMLSSLAANTTAKYTAKASAAASAQVAKWNVFFSQQPTNQGIAFLDNATTPYTAVNSLSNQKFKIKNDSDVMAEIAIHVHGYNDYEYASVGNVTNAHPEITIGDDAIKSLAVTAAAGVQNMGGYKYRLNPHTEAEFTIEFKPAEAIAHTTQAGCVRKYNVFFEAVQVD